VRYVSLDVFDFFSLRNVHAVFSSQFPAVMEYFVEVGMREGISKHMQSKDRLSRPANAASALHGNAQRPEDPAANPFADA
jgi:hypothetical protein